MTSFSAGLDFGTSNSTIGIAAARGVALAPVEGAHHTLPSAVFFDFERDQVLHGRAAMKAYVDGIDGRLLRALKSVLGSSLINETTQVRRRRVPFAEIIGLFLKRLKQAAEAAAGGPVDKVVLGRPVRFVDHDDEADRHAERELAGIAAAQGFAHVAFQLEPVAAALDHETSLAHEELAMIVDLGGGTSDFALIRLSPERSRKVDRSEDILGRSGVHIGGTDFDRLLSVARVMPELGLQARIGPKQLPMPNWCSRISRPGTASPSSMRPTRSPICARSCAASTGPISSKG